jgi:hypothetical protein
MNKGMDVNPKLKETKNVNPKLEYIILFTVVNRISHGREKCSS